MGIPKGMTRGLVVFCLAMLISYGVAWIVDWLATWRGRRARGSMPALRVRFGSQA